jgi:Protein of unknown function (DUF3187)
MVKTKNPPENSGGAAMGSGGVALTRFPCTRRASSLAGVGKDVPVVVGGEHGRSYGSPWSIVKCGLSCCVARPIGFLRLLALLLLLAAPRDGISQGLPEFSPLNPAGSSQSGLYFQPYRDAAPGRWVTALALDYASAIEYNRLTTADYVLDSELLRISVGLSRDLGARTFLLMNTSIQGAYPGFMDGFLDWYHGALGIRVLERERRPRDRFLYTITLPNGTRVTRSRSDLYLGDVRVGFGIRHNGNFQSVLSLTLPTSTGPDGFGRGVPSVGVMNTYRSRISRKLVYEGGVGLGFTPSRGGLIEGEREVFLAATSGLRLQVWGRQSLYANLFYHSPYYRNTTLPALDLRELSLDFGWILQNRRGGEWRIGLTEDLEPGGPGIDLVLRFGRNF